MSDLVAFRPYLTKPLYPEGLFFVHYQLQNSPTATFSTHMNRFLFTIFLLFTLLFMAATATSAPIYVTKDEAGNPVFSDQKSETSEEVTLRQPTTYDPGEFIQDYDKVTFSVPGEEPAEFKYKKLTVAAPDDEAALRDNAGNLELLFVIEPGVQTGHNIALIMDGEKHSNVSRTGSVLLENVDRGTHEFYLQVTRAADNSKLQTGPVTSVSVLRRRLPRPSHN